MPDGKLPIPPVVRRNMIKLFLFRVIFTVAFQSIFPLARLMATQLTGNEKAGGLPLMYFNIGLALMVYPLGWIMDKFGRKPALLIGSALEAISLVSLAGVMNAHSVPLMWTVFFVFGASCGIGQILNPLGADMFPPNRRAEGISILAFGSSLGVFVGPMFAGALADLNKHFGLDSLGATWFQLGILAAVGFIILMMVRPDPQQIALNLKTYYPDYIPPEKESEEHVLSRPLRSIWSLMSLYPVWLPFICLFCFQSVRNSIAPHITAILIEAKHSTSVGTALVGGIGLGGMLSVYFMGLVSDRWGRKRTLLLLTVCHALAGVIIPLMPVRGPAVWLMYPFFFLQGMSYLGTVNAAGGGVLADVTHPKERARIFSVQAIVGSASAALFAPLAGYIEPTYGFRSVSIMLAITGIIPIIAASRLREVSVGVYDHPGARPEDIPK